MTLPRPRVRRLTQEMPDGNRRALLARKKDGLAVGTTVGSTSKLESVDARA